MATAKSGFTLTTTRQRLFDSATDGSRCSGFFVACRSDSSYGAEVNIPGLHAIDEWCGVPPGSKVEFRIPSLNKVNGITDVFARGVGGSATIDCGVLEKLIV